MFSAEWRHLGVKKVDRPKAGNRTKTEKKWVAGLFLLLKNREKSSLGSSLLDCNMYQKKWHEKNMVDVFFLMLQTLKNISGWSDKLGCKLAGRMLPCLISKLFQFFTFCRLYLRKKENSIPKRLRSQYHHEFIKNKPLSWV